MKRRIQQMIGVYSMNQAERDLHTGQIGQATFEAYCRVWDWITPRFGGTTGWRHDCFWKRHGKAAYYAKINRVRVAFNLKPYATPN